MNKQELLRHIGSVEQIGGIRRFTFNDGRAKGVDAVEVNTGNLRFTVLPDRCLDIAQAFYKTSAVSWISKTGITSPMYYEKDGKSFMRGFYGGLVTTCGLKNIGRPTPELGLHGRISNIAAQKVSVFADWVGDEYVMKISGEMRESVVGGENLVLKRTISTKLFSDEFTLEDTVVNEGFDTENIALCYHCNFGYPLVRPGAKIINVPSEVSEITAPVHKAQEECVDVKYTDDIVTVGIENGEISAYVTYGRKTIPDFLLWKMLGESEYAVGLEPRTTSLGGENIVKNNKFIPLGSFEEYKTNLKFSFKSL
ncbi:MAG: DUF4432 family protein [Ruminococcaceae bacterium]|nr:DUF4432 family protein [Oscillospiraceae bacterium]